MPRKKKPEMPVSSLQGRQLEILAPYVTRISLQMPEDFTEIQWTAVGGSLSMARGATAWWCGDWLNQGEAKFRDKAIQAACELLNIDPGTANTYRSVCEMFPPERRRDLLSFEHHKEVRGLDRRHQEKWLDEAAGQKWSRADLRRNMKEAGVKQQPKIELVENGQRRTTVELYEKFREYMEQVPILWEPLRDLLETIGEQWETRLPQPQALDMLEKTIDEFLVTLHRLQTTTLEIEKLENQSSHDTDAPG